MNDKHRVLIYHLQLIFFDENMPNWKTDDIC